MSVNGVNPESYGPPVMSVDEGPGYTVRFAILTPHGLAQAMLPVPEARRLAQLVMQMAADLQQAQIDAGSSETDPS